MTPMPNIASNNKDFDINNNNKNSNPVNTDDQDPGICKMDVDTNEKSAGEFTIKFSKGSSAPLTETSTTSKEPKTRPVPGSVEWYELRKENHKKVERKRRETINQAMEDLGAVIPGNEKNKSRLLGAAVRHIKALMEEIIGLRKQVDHYRLTTQQQQMEIVDLKARLEAQQQQQQQQQQQDGQQQQQQRQMQNHTPCAPPVISS
ncbi:hypothetical protein BC941DRAFT_422544 [Chlamydoabsidia padenii]|nr:hypothetical protein BC941DRAFT_422544 [Chlamydoabsidia padenii]